MYTSVQFYIASKCTMISSYQVRQKPVHAKDLVLVTKLSDTCSDSFTIFGLWVLGLAVSNINESQLQTYES